MNASRGKPYQQLVAEVANAFDPGAKVTEGEWIVGPDGRLDMDVAIRGQINGKDILTVIECKDFNPKSTGKVGRAFVDALDSKRHDLGTSVAMICSNSGFTADALHKAKRKGIGMISVLRRGDDRIKAEIVEEILLRRIRFGEWRFTYHGIEDISSRLAGPSPLHLLRFNGCSLDTWLQHRALLVAMANPTIDQRLRASFDFKEPLAFSCGETPLILRAAEVSFIYTTEWLCQTVRLDATLGMYDYLRGRVRLGPGENKYVIEGVNWESTRPCDPPEPSTVISIGLIPGEIDVTLIMTEGLDISGAPELPQLEPYIVPSDLDCRIPKEV